MQAPYYEIKNIWDEIKEKNYNYILDGIAQNAVIMMDGKYLDKVKFADELASIDCSSFTIEYMQVIIFEENVVQSVHDTRLVPIKGKGSDVKYRIMTTWSVSDDDNKIISLNILTV